MTSKEPLAAVVEEVYEPTPGPMPDDWIRRLTTPGVVREAAIADLHALMVRAATTQVNRMSDTSTLGAARRAEIIQSAADEATVSVLSRLATFEGRSRFTTWAYKFAILHAAVETRRAAWRSREVDLYSVPEPVSAEINPEAFTEASSLADAVRHSILEALTPHQQRVATALLIDGVPIDVLAERLGSTRNALYKTLHDARSRLRTDLTAKGFLHPSPIHAGPTYAGTPKEATR